MIAGAFTCWAFLFPRSEVVRKMRQARISRLPVPARMMLALVPMSVGMFTSACVHHGRGVSHCGCLVALGVSCGVLCFVLFLLCISFVWLVLARSAVAA